MQINHKLLCLFEGKCWHGVENEAMNKDWVCSVCGDEFREEDYSPLNICMPFLQWFWKERKEMWEEFGNWQWERWFQEDEALRPYTINSNYMWLFSLTTEGEPRIMVLLSEWLALPETREMWGWEECPYRKEWPRTAKDGGSSFFCEKECKQEPPPCNGSGRIKAEWAIEVKDAD
jgi:hypothetical protein